MTTFDPYKSAALNELGQEILEINKVNGWNITTPDVWAEGEEPSQQNAYRLGAIIALIHSEASEALEAIRHNDRANFAEELADIVIRVLDVAAGLKIDMDEAVSAKLQKNKGRGYKHGGKVI